MNAALLGLLSLGALLVAYFTYGRFLAYRVFGVNPDHPTPAHTQRDDLDYVPTAPHVLFGHHFASIAGLGPILGPAIAVAWGWAPALGWVIFGSIFVGAVHDLGAMIVSLRHEGRSIGELTADLIGARAKFLFLVIIFFLLALAMGVFVLVLGILFTSLYPEAVLPSFTLIGIAMAMGVLVFKKGLSPTPITLVSLALMFGLVILGIQYPTAGVPKNVWIGVLMAYAFFASVLPVWLLLQPRDYLNSFLLYFGVIVIILGLLIGHPTLVAPAFRSTAGTDLPPMMPFLFITIACGAMSGFHSLVSSGTSVRQIDKENHAHFIGYGAMLAEAALAVVVILACAGGFATREAWMGHYGSWAGLNGLGAKLDGFIHGSAFFMANLGLPVEWSKVFIAVVVVAFAMTTLDSGTRLLRYNVEEIARSILPNRAPNRYLSSAVAVVAIGAFAWVPVGKKAAGLALWQLFGTTNQLLASLGLLVVTIYLYQQGKKYIFTLLPMLLMMFMTGWAILKKLSDFGKNGEWFPFSVGALVATLALWMIIEALLWWVANLGGGGGQRDDAASETVG